MIKRIEHFGSTAVPGISAKAIVDILVTVTSLDEANKRIAPFLEAQGYDYFWRPTWGDDTPPFYVRFIKRDRNGNRTHHIHMVEPDFEHWEKLLFRDYFIEHPDLAREYSELKEKLLRFIATTGWPTQTLSRILLKRLRKMQGGPTKRDHKRESRKRGQMDF